MSMPNIPNMNPQINISTEEALNMLIASVAMEDMGLSNIINVQAEKMQYILETLKEEEKENSGFTLKDINDVNKSLDKTLRNVISNQMLLQFKLEDILEMYSKVYSVEEETLLD